MVLVAVATSAVCAPGRGYAQEGQPPALKAGVFPDDIAIDGVLNEPAWDLAQGADAFAQADPTEGAAPAGRTVVRVLAGPKALVIGILCEDPDQAGIVSFSVRRDAALGNEDHVRVVLDRSRTDGRDTCSR